MKAGLEEPTEEMSLRADTKINDQVVLTFMIPIKILSSKL